MPDLKELVRTAIEHMSADHPRLLPYDRLQSALQTPDGKAFAEAFVREAEKMLEQPETVYQVDGKRIAIGLFDNIVLYCAFAYRVGGDKKFLRRAEREMMIAADFESWHPEHFLDTAMLMRTLAIGSDWLWHDLSPEARETINAGLLRHTYSDILLREKPFWLMGYNNWTQVCRCGYLFSALGADGRSTEERVELVYHCLDGMEATMSRFYGPDGTYPEGPGYWVYGTDHNVLLLALLECTLGNDFGLLSAKGFRDTLAYLDAMCCSDAFCYSYADTDRKRTLYSFAAEWLMHRFNLNDRKSRDFFEARRKIASGEHDLSSVRGPLLMPLSLLYWNTTPTKFAPRGTDWGSADCETPVAMHRNAMFYLGIKGGSPSGSHGHMDGGSFLLEYDGVRFCDDPGTERYNRIEAAGVDLWNFAPESSRWDLFAVGMRSHNLLRVGEANQRLAGSAKIIRHNAQETEVDLTSLIDAPVGAVRRTFSATEEEVTICDRIEGGRPGELVRFQLYTSAEIECSGDQAVLRRDGKTLRVRVFGPSVAWSVCDSSDFGLKPYEMEQTNRKILFWETRLGSDGALEAETVFLG